MVIGAVDGVKGRMGEIGSVVQGWGWGHCSFSWGAWRRLCQ